MTDPLDQIRAAILANCDEIVIADLKASYSNLDCGWRYEDENYQKKVRKSIRTVLRFYMSDSDYQEWRKEVRAE